MILFCAFTAQANDLVTERGWVEDPSGAMSLSEIKKAKESPLTTKLFSKGYSQSAFWIRMRIDSALQSLVIIAENRERMQLLNF